MTNRRSFDIAIFVAALVMAVVIPVLAYLQYIWLGELSEKEFRRMQENARAGALHCSTDLTREFADLINALGGTPGGHAPELARTLRERIAQWKAAASHPRLVEGETAIDPVDADREYYRLSIGNAAFLSRDLTSLSIPLEPASQRTVTVPINRQYLFADLLPDLIRTHLPESIRQEYDVVVTDNDENPLFSTADSLTEDVIETSDIVVPFLTLPAHIREMPTNRTGDSSQSRPQGSAAAEPDSAMGRPMLFELRLRHREGSLEEAVSKNRRRNLAVSVGALLTLGASIVFLLVSAKRAQRLAQQQLEFVAGISHELRTPLSVLKSAGENLADGIVLEDRRVRQYGRVINDEVSRLSAMVENTLSYAAVQSGTSQYAMQELDIEAVVVEALQRIRDRYAGTGCELDLRVGHPLPTVNGNRAALHSAFENLFANAVKYSKGTGKVDIHILPTSHPSGIEITVRDDGMGIPRQEIGNIFKPFYRARNAVDEQIPGSGLGLSITRHIINAHGGSIGVASSVGKETVFTTRIPAFARPAEHK
jgi:signal transduction histidine kinase